MRLPWWPIYVDARLDERGAYFSHPKLSIDFVPWHLVEIRGQYLVCYEENGQLIRLNRAPVFLRVNQKSRKQAWSDQRAYFKSSSIRFRCGVDQKAYSRTARARHAFISFYVTLLPLILFAVMIRGYTTIPQNDPGSRYQNALLFAILLLVVCTLYAHWRLFLGARITRSAKEVLSVNESGITVQENSGSFVHHAWDDIDLQNRFVGHLATTHRGEHLLFPQNCQAWRIARHKFNSGGLKSSNGIFYFALGVSIMSGPISWAWFTYLLPNEKFPSHLPWSISLLATGQVLVIAGLAYLGAWFEKRRVR